jgi:hypothetical protein
MSYKHSLRQTYWQRQKHTSFAPTRHYDFRQEWEANFENAIAQANKIKEQGYLVEEGMQKGALTENQAQRIAKRLQSAGWDVQLIPIATWAGERVVFVVFKPPKEQEAPAPTTPQPGKPKKSDAEKLYERYFKTFWGPGSDPPDLQEFANKGYLVDPSMYVALITPTSQSQDSLVTMLRNEQAKGQPLTAFDNTPKLRTATTKNKSMGSQFVVLDSQGKIGVRIRYFSAALRVLGKGKVTVYSPGADMPIYLVRDDGHAIAIAPPTDLDVTKAVTVDSLVMQSQQQT